MNIAFVNLQMSWKAIRSNLRLLNSKFANQNHFFKQTYLLSQTSKTQIYTAISPS